MNFYELDGNDIQNMNNDVLSELSSSMIKLDDKGQKSEKLINTANTIYKKSENFKPIAKLAVALTTKGMEERHWIELKEKTGIDCLEKEGLTLEKIISENTIDTTKLNSATLLADKASKEFDIKVKLDTLEERWKKCQFRIFTNNSVGGWGNICTVLDEYVVF